MKEKITHPFEPVFDENSRVLILGSIPSPKSREQGFYYGHPQNRFWKVLAKLFHEHFPNSIEEKKYFVLKHHIALWDVVKSCEIKGASDSSISKVEVNDIQGLIEKTKIQYIITTGKKADFLYHKYVLPITNIESICLPSTSPANCAMKEEILLKNYQILEELIK
ncbi:MAG: DNA-deoxyinosine glycosylase [Bacilli bacterium]|nr:DNA-deoxyinosine glycosylase [Bacilli bacterium]